MNTFRLSYRVALEAFYRFNRDDGWAIASHIALSVLMALFPFLIVVTSLAGFVGSGNLADEVARLIVALNFSVVTWASFMSVYGIVSKLGLFLIQYAVMRYVGVRRRRAVPSPAAAA